MPATFVGRRTAGLKLPALAARFRFIARPTGKQGFDLARRPCIATAHLGMSFGKPSR
jgi:hypothetical protein